MQFSPRSVFLHFRSKYLPQHSVLKNPQSMSLSQSETKFHTRTAQLAKTHILINLKSYLSISDSINILYSTSVQTEVQVSIKFITISTRLTDWNDWNVTHYELVFVSWYYSHVLFVWMNRKVCRKGKEIGSYRTMVSIPQWTSLVSRVTLLLVSSVLFYSLRTDGRTDGHTQCLYIGIITGGSVLHNTLWLTYVVLCWPE